jgi:hypothetical protein
MKKITISFILSVAFSISAFCQLDEVKTFITLSQFDKAKAQLDVVSKKPKNLTNPEYFIAKAAVLSHLIRNSATPNIPATRDSAIVAFKRYIEMDPSKKFILDPTYNAAAINFYVSYFGESVDLFNKKDWANASPSLKKTIEWSDFIIDNKIANMTFDTTVNLLTAVSYQNENKETEAAFYYRKLAEKKIGGPDNDIAYRFMMNYCFGKDDMECFEKMKAYGKELYPNIQYFTYTDLDFILEIENEEKKFKKLDAKLSKDAGNIELIQTYGFLLFNKLNAEGASEKVVNYTAEEAKMVELLTKVGDAKPDDGNAYFYAGSHFWNKALRTKDQIGLINDTIRIANSNAKPDKTGKLPPPPKALTDRRDNFRKLQEADLDKSLPYLLKATKPLEATSTKGKVEMQTFKRLIDQLIEIYSTKRQLAKLPADKTKYEAEEKKWDALYAKLSEK